MQELRDAIDGPSTVLVVGDGWDPIPVCLTRVRPRSPFAPLISPSPNAAALQVKASWCVRSAGVVSVRDIQLDPTASHNRLFRRHRLVPKLSENRQPGEAGMQARLEELAV